MRMPMMDIREVRVLMRDGDMNMPVLVRFVAVPTEIVRMPVMFVMDVTMPVFHRLVHVFVKVRQENISLANRASSRRAPDSGSAWRR